MRRVNSREQTLSSKGYTGRLPTYIQSKQNILTMHTACEMDRLPIVPGNPEYIGRNRIEIEYIERIERDLHYDVYRPGSYGETTSGPWARQNRDKQKRPK